LRDRRLLFPEFDLDREPDSDFDFEFDPELWLLDRDFCGFDADFLCVCWRAAVLFCRRRAGCDRVVLGREAAEVRAVEVFRRLFERFASFALLRATVILRWLVARCSVVRRELFEFPRDAPLGRSVSLGANRMLGAGVLRADVVLAGAWRRSRPRVLTLP